MQDQKENNMFKITGSVKKIQVVTAEKAQEIIKEAEVKEEEPKHEEVKEIKKSKKSKKQDK